MTKEEVIKSFNRIMEYIGQTEIDDYENYEEGSKEEKNHIANDFLKLQEYFDNLK